MNTKSGWQTAYDKILDEGRKRIPPPTVEQVEALGAGRLSEDEAEKVREALAYYPELLRVMTEPLPDDPGSVVTDEEIASGLAALKRRIARERSPQPSRRRRVGRVLARAAVVAVVVGGGAVAYKVMNRHEGTAVILSADGQLSAVRGGGQTPHQLSTGTDYVLRPAFRPDRPHDSYRLELFDISGGAPRSVETWSRVERAPDGSFPIEMSTKGYAEGRYQLVLYGVDESAVPLATYTIRLIAP
ncbi:MAG TPA: hypothetical protein VF846_08035 [Thermoanaerobaculia bacterium]|jgi:hypothetical protein